ncbi:heparinase II/III domain-containing protein [Actinopolymorpha alba]|uniref:heparinase II/III domain-containing protein n=1 Tax=Actinopolymorpha alba TaxID=533267 RepID=UPI00036B0886|nr:heparinase II/III family protein [Actinopolymorpha alba]
MTRSGPLLPNPPGRGRPSRRDFLRTAAAGTAGLAGLAGAVAPPGLPLRTAYAATPGTPAGVPAGIAAGVATTPTKTASTYYTPEKVAAVRRNIDAYDWARSLRDGAVAAARPYLAKGDEWLWRLVTGQRLPRSYAVNQTLGSPITGTDLFRFGNYPWEADPLNRPWKLVDPSSDYVFPTNDFGAYYASGLDEHGLFDPAHADRSLLVNELYPERGPTWGVDDGYGWVDDNGDKWTFIAYYIHWQLWYGATATAKAPLYFALRWFRDAYVYTGEEKYAHAGLILLDRIADVYPSMDAAAYRREDGYLQSDGLSGKGKVLGCIWENSLARDLVSSYDAFFPAIASGDDANVVPFLSAKAREFGLPPKDSVDAIKVNIENNIVRQTFPAVKGHQIAGNFGSHQATLATAAVVLDSATESREWIDWVFASGERVRDPDLRITGGNMYATLVEDVDRDGMGNEAAPHYNFLWIGTIGGVADALAGYPKYPAADLYQHPKYAQMIQVRPKLTMLNRYTPSIGDTGATGQPLLNGSAQVYAADFERYGTTEAAQLAYLLNGNKTDGLYGSIYSSDVEGTRKRIADVIATKGPLTLASVNLTGFGFGALRTGTGAKARELWVSYGRTSGHGHADALNIGLFGFGVDLMPDLGYPEFADNNARRIEWNANTIAHNTVTVDARKQAAQWVGRPYGFAATDDVQVIDVAAPKAYSQTSVYRRVTAQVKVDAENSYAVDFFRVVGGRQHHLSFHAAEGPVSTSGLTLAPQSGGTYAGPGVLPPADNAVPRANPSGFDWLSNVERDSDPGATFSVDWKVKDTWGVHNPDPDLHLRLTVLTDVDEVALCDGIPPRNKPGNPASLRYLIARRQGEGLASQFVSLIEPYVGQRYVRDVVAVKVRGVNAAIAPHEAAAVKVTLTNGRTDYVVSSLRTDVLLSIDDDAFTFRGAFGVYSLRDGKPAYAFGHDATKVGPLPRMQGPTAVNGTVTDFPRDLSASNTVTLRLAKKGPAPSTLVGSYVYVDNDGERNAAYRIIGAELVNDTTLILDIGAATTIRGYIDKKDFNQGYRYDLAVGAAARIPLTREWKGTK